MIVLIENDCYSANHITAIICVKKTLSIYIYHNEESFDYKFDSEEASRATQLKAVNDWKIALTQ